MPGRRARARPDAARTDVEKLSDAELAEAAEKATLFARLSPAHKERVIRILRGKGHVVGFMGDGINDAPALRAADVGISVDTATDIAKESADLILLEKDLMVLEAGVLEGRKVFANIVKYIRMGASSNFGNMFSVLGASAFLPFLPMAPIQVLTNNLLYDFSQVPIPADAVDEEQVARPRPWNIAEIRRFILFVGPISSIFDYTTFFVMLWVFNCWDPSHASLFQTGWFVESLMTQTLIIHVIRTNKIPFIQSRASLPLTLTTLSIMAFGIWLPYSPLSSALGLTQSAAPVLADSFSHAFWIHGAHTDHQGAAAAQALDLSERSSVDALAAEPGVHLVFCQKPILEFMTWDKVTALGNEIGGLGDAGTAIFMNVRRHTHRQDMGKIRRHIVVAWHGL